MISAVTEPEVQVKQNEELTVKDLYEKEFPVTFYNFRVKMNLMRIMTKNLKKVTWKINNMKKWKKTRKME